MVFSFRIVEVHIVIVGGGCVRCHSLYFDSDDKTFRQQTTTKQVFILYMQIKGTESPSKLIV